MQVFNGTVRLQASLVNEVSKRGLTVPEIYILRRIHGNDAVVKLQHVGDAIIDDADERSRLATEYNDGLGALSDEQKTSVQKMFGEFGVLPKELSDYTGELSEVTEELEFFQKSAHHSDQEEEDKIKGKAAKKASAKTPAKPLPKGEKALAGIM